MDRDRARRELDRLAGPGHRVRAAAGDLDRAVGRRALLDRAAEAGQGAPRPPPATAPVRRPGSARPRGRPSSTTPRSRPSPGSASGRRGGTRRAASPCRGTPAGRPLANGSSVPPWPTRFVAASRRTSPTTSWEVGPTGLATTRTPSRAAPSPRALQRADRGDQPLGLGEDRAARLGDRQRDRRAGRPGVAAAAERAGQDRRVDAARLRPDADPGPLPRLLEDDRDLGLLGLGEQVDDPLGVRRRSRRSRRGRRRAASSG